MKQREIQKAAGGFTRRQGLIALAGGVAALSGCGGGGSIDVGSVGSGGTGSFSIGSISGFGSIIVNGVRYDESKATITDDDGVARSAGDLKLGMVVAVTGSDVVGGTSRASSIVVSSELRGAIENIGTQTLVVLGQTVRIGTGTIFEENISGGLAGLAVGQLIEVHGFVDPTTNQISATRIERATTADTLKLEGPIQSLNGAAKTFVIGTVTISYAGLSANAVPSNLANGLLVRVRLAPLPATGTRNAVSVRSAARNVEDHGDAELEGTVTAFTSNSSFSVDGVPVNAGSASFPNGTTGLKVGARVQVKGSISNGVLVASSVQLETEDEAQNHEIELHGSISNLNISTKTFVIRGVTVSYAGSVRFSKGDAGTLALINGTSLIVEVTGTNNAVGNSVIALTISFES